MRDLTKAALRVCLAACLPLPSQPVVPAMAPIGDSSLDSLDGLDTVGGLAGLDGLVRDGVTGGEEDFLPSFEDLTPFEVEHFVQGLQEFSLEQVGDRKWLSHHERVEKLNWTAHSQAKEGHDEYVIDQLNTQEKLPMLVYDLMLIEVWKERVWPLVKAKIAKFSSLRTYIPVYHEASLVNLLEICLFHRTSCEEAGDLLIDLVDYCVRKLRYLLATPNDELVHQVTSAKECAEWDSVQLLDEQFSECEFQVCMCVISVLRFLTDHRAAVPLAVTVRLMDTHDVLLLLVPLMEKAPWVRKNRITGRIEKFEEHKWQVVEADDEGRLPKLHSQVWLAIYNLIMDSECRARYDMTSFRRENLLRLRRFINEVVVDQLPPLTNLHRTLEELAISGQFTGVANSPTPSPFVVELVAEVRERLLRGYDGRWQEVADAQLRDVLVKETPEELKRLGDMISIPKELIDEANRPLDDPCTQDGIPASAAPTTTAASWEALLRLTPVRSTASFFAAAGRAQAPPDEVLLLTVPPQPQPCEGDGRLRLELRRTRRGQLGAAALSSHGRAAAEAALLTQREEQGQGEEGFLIAVEGAAGAVRPLQYVSQKGAARSAQQLLDLLRKPGREGLLEMYCQDVAEFSVAVGIGSTAGAEEALDASYVGALLPAA